MRIAIIGYSASGKSTLAKLLSQKYNLPLLYLDTVHFEENWRVRQQSESIEIVGKFMQNESWVIDGNYDNFSQKDRLKSADKIIFMNFNRFNCMYRALKRLAALHNSTRESISKGCYEKVDLEFAWWILHEGRTKLKKQHFNDILNTYSNKTIVIKNQRQLNSFIHDNGCTNL